MNKPNFHNSLRIRHILLPFAASILGMLLFYSLLRWLIDIQLDWLELEPIILDFVAPGVLSLLLVIILLRKPIRMLDVSGTRGNGHMGYMILATLFIALPTVILQHHIVPMSFELTEVHSPEDVPVGDPERYYHFQQYTVDTTLMQTVLFGVNLDLAVDRNDLNANLYLTLPFGQLDSLAQIPQVWVVGKFYKEFNARIIDDAPEYEEKMSNFMEQSFGKFRTQLEPANIQYFERVVSQNQQESYLQGLKENSIEIDPSTTIFLLPSAEPFSDRAGNTLMWTLIILGLVAFAWTLMVMLPTIDEDGLTEWQSGRSTSDQETLDFLALFVPRGERFTTALMADLNILVFIVLAILGVPAFGPKASDLLPWGAISGELVHAGEYWRLFTGAFMHSGLIHLAFNMIGLIVGGVALEPVLGRWRLMIAYLLCAVFASMASVWWNPEVIACGASGAIFGLYGLMAALWVGRTLPAELSKVYMSIFLTYGLVSLVFGFLSFGVDNAAHVGGLLAGFIIGLGYVLLFRKQLRANAEK